MADHSAPRRLIAALLAWPMAAAEPPRIEVGGGVIELRVAAPEAAPPIEIVRRWVERAGQAVTIAYGRFPVASVRLDITAGRGRRGGGRTWCQQGGPRVRVGVEHDADDAKLAEDWVLTHEFVHLGFPDMPDDHAWMEEGLATYLEPMVRARAGQLAAERVWRDLVDSGPRGVPSRGGGLNTAREWGPTYWGGAMFWLLADVRIREHTRGKRSLDDALRAILAAFPGGTCAAGDVGHVIAVADRATGTDVLQKLHAELGESAFRPDFGALWKRLGVVPQASGVAFDDGAPLAGVRRAMTARSAVPSPAPAGL